MTTRGESLGELEDRTTDGADQERAWLMAIVEQMPGGLIIAEAPTGRVLIVNEEARTLLGIADGQSLHGIGRAFRPDGSHFEPDETPLARALEGETVTGELMEIVDYDGHRFVLNVRAAPIRDHTGRITAAVSMLENVTEREMMDRAERDFVTNAAHELQSPLAAITSAIDVLQAGAKDSAERDLFMGHIERESKRLDRLTKALLTLARTQVDVEPPRMELIDLCPMLEAIADRMEPLHGVELTVECPKETALVSNRELLEQAISNVVRNAVKYTEKGSIRLIGTPQGESVLVAVRDTGVGIPKSSLPRVSQRFYRADTSREGFGLGLAIVQESMNVLEGELEVASSPGYGTTVTLKLPARATRVMR
jgi:PAS domain S-box-containing protein